MYPSQYPQDASRTPSCGPSRCVDVAMDDSPASERGVQTSWSTKEEGAALLVPSFMFLLQAPHLRHQAGRVLCSSRAPGEGHGCLLDPVVSTPGGQGAMLLLSHQTGPGVWGELVPQVRLSHILLEWMALWAFSTRGEGNHCGVTLETLCQGSAEGPCLLVAPLLQGPERDRFAGGKIWDAPSYIHAGNTGAMRFPWQTRFGARTAKRRLATLATVSLLLAP